MIGSIVGPLEAVRGFHRVLLLYRHSWTACLICWLKLDLTAVWLLLLLVSILCELSASVILLVIKRGLCSTTSSSARILWVLL